MTVEGEQVILSLQCARFLLKACHTASKGDTLTETVFYLGQREKDTVPADITSLKGVLALLQIRSRVLSWRFTTQFDRYEQKMVRCIFKMQKWTLNNTHNKIIFFLT